MTRTETIWRFVRCKSDFGASRALQSRPTSQDLGDVPVGDRDKPGREPAVGIYPRGVVIVGGRPPIYGAPLSPKRRGGAKNRTPIDPRRRVFSDGVPRRSMNYLT